MFIESANFKLKLEEFQKAGSFSPSNETEEKVFWLANRWLKGASTFTFHTSGSTGEPKEITIARDKIQYSTDATFNAIDPNRSFKASLLCLDPGFIGGAMVVFRAMLMDLDLYIVEPSTHFCEELPEDYHADLVSLVPMQLKQLSPTQLKRFNTILVGGAPLSSAEMRTGDTNVYSTYGMTETVSHVALRKLQETHFSTVGDAEVQLAKDGCLEFKGKITDDIWLKTNDIGFVYSAKTFEWVGRKDFVINSGGIKVNPETVEQKLKEQIESRFIISHIPDERLGQKIVLILEGSRPSTLHFDKLSTFETPKHVYENQEIVRTNSGKVDRIKTQQQLLDALR